jgi:hypothetical protein
VAVTKGGREREHVLRWKQQVFEPVRSADEARELPRTDLAETVDFVQLAGFRELAGRRVDGTAAGTVLSLG